MNHRKLTPAVLAWAVSSCFVSAATADTAANGQTLSPVVVTASRVEQLQTDAIPTTQVITRETLENKRLAETLSLLRSETGIDFTRSGGRGTATAVYMRGYSPTQMLVMIDGVPVTDSNLMTTDSNSLLSSIDPEQIDHIEVVKGNVSSIYGSGAMGGVVHIFTKHGKDKKPTANVFAEYGSDNTYKVGAGASGSTEFGTSYSFSANQYRTDGFSAMNRHDKNFENANPDDDYNRTVSFNGAVSQKIGADHEIGFRIFGYNTHFDYDNNFDLPDDRHHGTDKQTTSALYSKNRWTKDWLSTVTASFTDMSKGNRYTSYGSDWRYGYSTKTGSLLWDNQIALGDDWTLTAGAGYTDEKGEGHGSDRYKKESRSKHTAYLGLIGKIGNHSLQANARYDHVEEADSDVTGYLGYGYDLTKSWKLIASVSSAFQAPNLYQQYSSSGFKDLKSEKSTHYEGGIQYASGKTDARLTYFQWHARDLIEFDYGNPTPNSPWGSYNNIDRAKNKGVEFKGKTELFGVSLGAHATWQNPENRDTGRQLIGRAKWLGGIDVSKTFGGLYVGADAQFTGHRTYSRWDMSSYTLVNLNARYEINKHLSLYGRVENLFDKHYETVYGYNQPGVSVFGGINLKM